MSKEKAIEGSHKKQDSVVKGNKAEKSQEIRMKVYREFVDDVDDRVDKIQNSS